MSEKFYIAYGSNLNVAQMRERCPDAKLFGTASLDGWRLLFKGDMFYYLTVEKSEGFCVPVGIWQVSGKDERALDYYEGYPELYYKTELDIPVRERGSGTVSERRAFIYIMHEHFGLGEPIPSYIDTCVQGYRDFGFDLSPLFEAFEYSKMNRS